MFSDNNSLYQNLKSIIESKQDLSTADIADISQRINNWSSEDAKKKLPTGDEITQLNSLLANNFPSQQQGMLRLLIAKLEAYSVHQNAKVLSKELGQILNLRPIQPARAQPTAVPASSLLSQAASQRSIDELYKKEKVGLGFTGKIAHRFFTDKNRPYQIEIVHTLIQQWNTSPRTISPAALYGGLLAVKSSIGNTKYSSRLNNLLIKLMQDPALKNINPAQAKAEFNGHLLANPGTFKPMYTANPVLQGIRSEITKHELMRQAANETGLAMAENIQFAESLINTLKIHGVENLYNKSRGIKSWIKQDAKRPEQIKQLQAVIDSLKGKVDEQGLLKLVGCLLKIESETPDNSALKKVVHKMFADMRISSSGISENDKERCKAAYEKSLPHSNHEGPRLGRVI